MNLVVALVKVLIDLEHRAMTLIKKKIPVKKLLSKLFKKKQDNIISFGQGFALTELPIISLYQGNKAFNFLLDTGSNDSIIDSNILAKMEHEMLDQESSLYGMEGNCQTVKRCNISLSYGDSDFPYEYLICDMKEAFGRIKKESGVTLHGIIGSKFFNEYKYVLDFESLVAYSKK
jgi:hypothetical protein